MADPARRLDEPSLAEWGRAFGRALRPPAVVGIGGELGSGKTTLVRAIAEGLGVTEPVTSPTFALVHRYRRPGGPVYHVDAYRLRGPAEAADLGLDEMAAEPDAIVLVEWPERLGAALPTLTHRIHLAHAGDPATRSLETA